MNDEIAEKILELATERGAEKTICPSEVARAIAPENWRNLIDRVRQEGLNLEAAGKIHVLQKGRVVDGQTARGPIRYRISRG